MQRPAPEPLPPGTSFAGYQIVRLRGSGTFGSVYEALRMPLRRRVALKLLDPRLAHHPEALARFEREALTTAALEHPHIVKVFDVGVEGDQHYLAMELLDGETLAERIAREGALPLGAVADLFVPLTSAVGHVHDRGCIHRDLKPGNVFLAERSGAVEPVLLDFGIVKAAQGVGDTRLTRKGALLGSPAYMSPEQARSEPIDPRSDQFSLGAIAWECLTGRRLFTGTAVWQILAAVSSADVPPIAAALPGLPPSVADAVARLLSRDREGRFTDVRQFGAALLPHASVATRARWEHEFPSHGAVSGKTVEVREGRDLPALPQPPSPRSPAGEPSSEAVTLPLAVATSSAPTATSATAAQPPAPDAGHRTQPLDGAPDRRKLLAAVILAVFAFDAILFLLLRRR